MCDKHVKNKRPHFEDFGELLRYLVEWNKTAVHAFGPAYVRLRRLDMDLAARCEKLIKAGLAKRFSPGDGTGNYLGMLVFTEGQYGCGRAAFYDHTAEGASK